MTRYIDTADGIYVLDDDDRRPLAILDDGYGWHVDDPAYLVLAHALGYWDTEDEEERKQVIRRVGGLYQPFYRRYWGPRFGPPQYEGSLEPSDLAGRLGRHEVEAWADRYPDPEPVTVTDEVTGLTIRTREWADLEAGLIYPSERVGRVYWQSAAETGGRPGYVLRLDGGEYLPDDVDEVMSILAEHGYEPEEGAAQDIAELRDDLDEEA